MKKQIFIILSFLFFNLNSKILINSININELEIINPDLESLSIISETIKTVNNEFEYEIEPKYYELFSSKSFTKDIIQQKKIKPHFKTPDEYLNFIKEKNQYKTIKTLSIINSQQIIKPILKNLADELKQGGSLDSVETLDLRANKLTSENIEPLIKVLNNTNLKTLSLECNYIDEYGIKLICDQLKNNDKMVKLLLGSNKELIDFTLYYLNTMVFIPSIIEMLNKNTTLKYISLACMGIDNPALAFIAKKLKNNQLETINFRANEISNTKYLINLLRNNPKLTIYIAKNYFSDSDIKNSFSEFGKRIQL